MYMYIYIYIYVYYIYIYICVFSIVFLEACHQAMPNIRWRPSIAYYKSPAGSSKVLANN